MFTRLADLIDQSRLRIVVVAALFVVVAAGLGGNVADRLLAAGFEDPHSESARANERLKDALGYDANPGMVVLARSRQDVRLPAVRLEVERIAADVRKDPLVARADTFYRTTSPALVSRDRRATLIAVHFRSLSPDDVGDATKRLRARVRSDKLELGFGGFGAAFIDVNDQVRDDLVRAEVIAFPALFLLLVLVFRGLVAALLPLSIGVVAVMGSFLGLRLLAGALPISIFAVNVVTGLGLGLAIDYSLFLVWRYREELEARGPGRDALRVTLATAGRTVLFSGLTVAAAMAALTIFPERFLYSMGLAGVLVALLSAAAALLVVPALLALLGGRVNALSLRRRAPATGGEGRWYRMSRFVMRRPIGIATLSAAVLIALASPFLGAKFTGINGAALPESQEARQVDDALKREFLPNRDAPINVAIAVPASERAKPPIEAFRERIARLDSTAAVGPVRPIDRDTRLLQIISTHPPFAEESTRLVRDIRALAPPAPLSVGGQTADLVDFKSDVRQRLPLMLAIVASAMLLLLFAMTGSLLLPVKAFVMSLLAVAAALGLVVLVFQQGYLEGLLDYRSTGSIETADAVLLFALIFGLSTDYGVFLISRIKEHHDRGAANDEAIAMGMQRTGRLVTAAALVMSVAFLAFLSSTFIFIKQFALGTGLGILIDATIVRALLVPALMRLMGDWNWWAPKPLRRLHQRFRLEEVPGAAASAVEPGAGTARRG